MELSQPPLREPQIPTQAVPESSVLGPFWTLNGAPLDCVASNGRLTDEGESIWKEVTVA